MRGSETDRPSSKASNNEIVKALIVLTQDFFNHNSDVPAVSDQLPFKVTIDEGNLIPRITMALRHYPGLESQD